MRIRPSLMVALSLSLGLAACADGGPLDAPDALAPEAASSSLAPADHSIVLEDVALGPGATADLHVRVYVDESSATCGSARTAVALHGFAHTAATFEPLADALFAQDHSTCRVLALDLPGHGDSPLPEGIVFGDMALDHYVAALTGALGALADRGLEAHTLLAHSQGGLVVQMAQDALVAQGSSLRDAFGIRAVTLLAPVPPAQVDWAFAGPALGLLAGFITPAPPPLGVHISIPDAVWPVLFFSNLAGDLQPGSLDFADVPEYNAPEPLVSALQLVGAAPFPGRVPVASGIFSGSHGSRLAVIAFGNDQIVRPHEAEATFQHLTGGRSGDKMQVVTGEAAIHDLYIADPDAVIEGARIPLP